MAAGFVFLWDPVNKVWVKIACSDEGKIKIVIS